MYRNYNALSKSKATMLENGTHIGISLSRIKTNGSWLFSSIIVCCMFLTTFSLNAQTNSIYESYAILSLNGGSNAYYDMNASTGNPDFQGSVLGTYNASNSLVVKGGQNKTSKCAGGDVFNGRIYWRVWLTSAGASGSFTTETMGFLSNDGSTNGCGAGNQTWEGTSGASNIISGLTVPGNYTLEVYSDADGVPGTTFSNNGGANFKATFTFCGPLSGPLSVGNYAIPGCFATVADAVTYINANGVTGTGIVQFDLAAGGSETAPAGGIAIRNDGLNLGTGTATTAIKFVKAAGAAYTITAPTTHTLGAINDAIIKIIGGDYITIDGLTLLENAANSTTTAASNTMTEFGIALFYASTTNGSQNNTFQNNTITLKRIYQNAIGIYSNTRHTATAMTTVAEITSVTGANSFNKVYSNTISNVNYGTVFIGSGAATINGFMDNGTDIGGSSVATGNTYTNWGGIGVAPSGYSGLTGNNYCVFINNTYNDNISFNTITSAAAVTGLTIGGLLKNYSGGAAVQPTGTITTNINNNTVTITNTPITAAGTVIGLNNQGLAFLATATVNMNNNTIQNCLVGGTTATTAGLTCITNLSAAGTINMTGNSVINNAITSTASTTGSLVGVSNSGAGGTVNITGNVVRSMSSSATTTGQMQGIANSGAATTAININNNQLGNATSGLFTSNVASAGAFFGIVNANAGATSALSIQNNDIRGITYNVTASSSAFYINVQGAGSPFSQNISNNTFTNLNVNTTGSVSLVSNFATAAIATGGSQTISNNSIVTGFNKGGSGGVVSGITTSGVSSNVTTSLWNANNFSNITVSGTTTVTGISAADTGNVNQTITNNTISNITGGTGTITGIASANGGGNGGDGNVLSGNTISNLSGSGNVNGISYTSGNVSNIFKNKIYDLSGSSATSLVNGMSISGGTTNTIYNNLVGNLITANANANNPLNGLNIAGTGTVNAYFNTIYLNGSSTGALFGSSAINASDLTNLTLQNNIFVNNSTVSGAGLAVAYRRSSTTLTSYQAASNNNLFASNNNIFTDGTNTDATIAAYKVRVASRDAASFSENPNFLSTAGSNANFLHIDTTIATQIESGGTAISGITDDYDGNTRNVATPDVGADEFTGIGGVSCTGAVGGNALGSITNCGPTTDPAITASGYSVGTGSTYQWMSSTTAGNYPNSGTPVVGEVSPGSLTTGVISATTYYWLRVTCTSGTATAYSNMITITITPIPTAPTGLECWETATLNTSTCTWEVTGTQPPMPTVVTSTLASQGFDDVTTLIPSGWSVVNTSTPIGTSSWSQGGTPFAAQTGAANSYVACNFNSVAGANTISNWLIAPETIIQNGDVIKFWTRTVSPVSFPDRLQVRLSTTGAGTNPNSPTDVGSYTTLLTDINPTLTTTGYPTTFTEYTVTVSGLAGPTNSRVAFRYFVTNGGPLGANSEYIGIDTFSITRETPLACGQSYTFNNTSCQWELVTGPCASVVNLKLFIEGYYLGGGAMKPVNANQGVGVSTTDVETITVELHNSSAPYALAHTTPAMLQTNGTAVATFNTAPSGSFYLVVRTRNAVETWSATPQTVGASPLTYDFSSAASQAFGSNMLDLGSGVFGFYSGDINLVQDGNIDTIDYPIWETDSNNFESGFFATDINGDGNVDTIDYPIWENNSNNFVSVVKP